MTMPSSISRNNTANTLTMLIEPRSSRWRRMTYPAHSVCRFPPAHRVCRIRLNSLLVNIGHHRLFAFIADRRGGRQGIRVAPAMLLDLGGHVVGAARVIHEPRQQPPRTGQQGEL